MDIPNAKIFLSTTKPFQTMKGLQGYMLILLIIKRPGPQIQNFTVGFTIIFSLGIHIPVPVPKL